jgi:hypothetical protein
MGASAVEQAGAKVTAAEVRAALALRYPSKSHALMFEVAPRTGGGTRYADAVAVGLWASHGHPIEGFEIKVSRSDWLHEMKQPEKSEPVMRYCNRWWLVCPKGVAAPDELPDTWGLLELHENGTLRVRVNAPKLEPVPVDRGFFASLVRRGVEADNATLDVLMQRERAGMVARLRDELSREGRRELSLKQERANEAIARLEALKEKTGIDFSDFNHGDDWFAAVDLLRHLGADYGRGSLRVVREALVGIAEAIDASGLLASRVPSEQERVHG